MMSLMGFGLGITWSMSPSWETSSWMLDLDGMELPSELVELPVWEDCLD